MSKKQEAPKITEIEPGELAALKDRLINQKGEELTNRDFKLLLEFINFSLWLQERLSRAKLTIKKLQTLFGFKSESKQSRDQKNNNKDEFDGHDSDENADSLNTDAISPSNNPSDESATSVKISPVWDDEKNHGRLAAADYTGCPVVDVPFDNYHLQQGLCPYCAEVHTDAKVYPTECHVVVLLEGRPLVSGNRYSLQGARCCVCHTRFTASLPAELKDQPKYDKTCVTAIAVNHYYAGLPFYRIEMLQAAQGVPLPDATQFDLVNRLYQGVVMAVFLALERCAAQGRSFFFDDTPSRILEQMALNKTCDNKKDKRAVHATALVSEYQDNTIYLFKTNTQTAGAEFKTLLSGRETDAEYMSMSDALSHNFPTMEESLMARWIITLCLVHGRRNFIHCLDAGDDNAKFVINTLAQVYEHEAHCKKAKLNTVDRLHYHQKHSAPLMAALKRWMNNLILHKSVEPNSRLGEAIAYMLKRWHELTQFLRVAGAQLDNNIAEQTIKVLIRYRKNAYFYRTFYGAEIGDAMMSVLHTAARHGISIFDYVNTLQSHREQVRTSPEDWLPWNVEETLNQLEAYREAA